MRVVIIEFMSLDGVVQAPGGPEEDTDGGFAHGGWSHPFFDETVGAGFDEALRNADALLYGRRTWQTMAAAWPERAGDPFADRMNSISKYVVSSTLRDDGLTWGNTTRIPGDEVVERIRELRERDGGDVLVMGSPTLARTLLHDGLVDELRLMIEPVILGGGKTIYPGDGELRTLELVSTVTSGTGVLVCTYRPARRASRSRFGTLGAMTTREAACHCGQLRLEVEGDPFVVSICHCLACKRRTGSAFGMQAAFTPDQMTILGRYSTYTRISDEADEKPHDFHFCPDCGSNVFYTEPDEPDLVVVSAGSFADPAFPPPTESGYDSRRHPWLAVPSTIERHDGQ